jgi:hypothetical protein
VYLGPITHYYLETPEGQSLVVYAQNTAAATVPWKTGDLVSCLLEAQSAFLLRG